MRGCHGHHGNGFGDERSARQQKPNRKHSRRPMPNTRAATCAVANVRTFKKATTFVHRCDRFLEIEFADHSHTRCPRQICTHQFAIQLGQANENMRRTLGELHSRFCSNASTPALSTVDPIAGSNQKVMTGMGLSLGETDGPRERSFNRKLLRSKRRHPKSSIELDSRCLIRSFVKYCPPSRHAET